MKIKLYFAEMLMILFLISGYVSAHAGGIIVDHNCTDLSKISEQGIKQAKKSLHIAYGHTSHGSQLVSGMKGLVAAKGNLYSFNQGGRNGALDFHDRAFSTSRHDLGHKGSTKWADQTRTYLNNSDNSKCNVVIWSWCGGASGNTEKGMRVYLETMNLLEKEYPKVAFVYMTGHLDGSGKMGNLHVRNEQIRRYCHKNSKILFDFADIESYDPAGNFFLDKQGNDKCDYKKGNWAEEWCKSHPESCWYNGKCAHSQPLNCQMKGIAAWWLWVKIANP